MGSEDFYPEERPVRRVDVDGFWIDEHPVTAAEFRRFVRETGYVTVAERPLDPDDYPDADPDLLVPGSLVFRKTAGPVPLDDDATGGSTCRARPGRNRADRARRSTAATGIQSCRLPTRTRRLSPPGRARSFPTRPSGSTPPAAASKERAFAWGDEHFPNGDPQANTWQGEFPWQNLKAGRLRRNVARRQLSTERLRALRRVRQRLGVDERLVHVDA